MRIENLRWFAAICVLAALSMWGCADQRTTCGRVGDTHVACSHKNILKDLAHLEVAVAGKEHPVVKAPVSSIGRRPDVSPSEIEILNLPEGWQSIRAVRKDGSRIVLVGEKAALPPRDPAEKRLPWFLRHWILTPLFLFMIFYVAVSSIETGGPNHGEHPFLITLVHLLLFFWLAEDWDPDSYSLYRILLFCALGYSIFCRLTIGTPLRYVNALVMVAFYATFFYLINVKDYSAVAQWTSQDVAQLYVPEKDRGRLEALDSAGKVLRSFEFKSPRDRWAIYIVGPQEAVNSFQVTPPSGPPYTVPIGTPGKG
jgi:hypothetical protein